MRSLYRGLVLILFLFAGFLVIDVLGREDLENPEEADNSEFASQAAPELEWPAAPELTPIAILAPYPASTPEPQLTPTTATTPTAAPQPQARRTTTNDDRDLITLKREGPGETFFDTLLTPFVAEARKRRAELAKTDPDFVKRIDPALNETRINFLLFGYGETHEPPATERAIIGSHTIISYDTRTHRVDIISLTHDIRGPEIERELAKQSGKKSLAVRIDQAYNVGGFKLMRRMLEDATGLSIDFQVTFKDSVMQSLVDSVFGGIEVNVPTAFDVHPFYLDGKKYDRGHFTQGWQRLSGRQVIQFIKTVPVTEGAYDKSLEHNVRKALVFDGILDSVNKNYQDRAFWLRGSGFVASEMMTGSITYDFDPVALMITNIGTTTASIRRNISRSRTNQTGLPKISQSKYVVDPAHGDGGVQWVGANAPVNPLTKKDIDEGVYPSMDLEIPISANPYGDLVTEYWPSVRTLVRNTLTQRAP